jgi:hypothetical protein
MQEPKIGCKAEAEDEGALMKPLKVGLLAATILSVVSGLTVLAQRQGGGGSQMPPQQSSPMTPSINSNRAPFPGGMGGNNDPSMGMPDTLGGRLAEQQARTRNNERQKKLESDTEKLVGLVTDLKSQVQGEKTMSPTDLSKRAEEIEKLARSVKDRMKG